MSRGKIHFVILRFCIANPKICIWTKWQPKNTVLINFNFKLCCSTRQDYVSCLWQKIFHPDNYTKSLNFRSLTWLIKLGISWRTDLNIVHCMGVAFRSRVLSFVWLDGRTWTNILTEGGLGMLECELCQWGVSPAINAFHKYFSRYSYDKSGRHSLSYLP